MPSRDDDYDRGAYRKEYAFDFKWPEIRVSDKELKASAELADILHARGWDDPKGARDPRLVPSPFLEAAIKSKAGNR
jgi:hypothetical protein